MMNTAKDTRSDAADKRGVAAWLKRLGWAGLLFFTLKGLVWLLIFWGAADWLL